MKTACLFTALMLFIACSQRTYTANVSNNHVEEEGTIRITSNGKGPTLPQAYDNAVETAFYMLIFKGIPESVQSTPLVADETNAMKQHAAVFDCFKDKGCYAQFLTHAAREGSKKRVRGEKLLNYQVSSDVTINLRALRTYLEQKNVIRKFGF